MNNFKFFLSEINRANIVYIRKINYEYYIDIYIIGCAGFELEHFKSPRHTTPFAQNNAKYVKILTLKHYIIKKTLKASNKTGPTQSELT